MFILSASFMKNITTVQNGHVLLSYHKKKLFPIATKSFYTGVMSQEMKFYPKEKCSSENQPETKTQEESFVKIIWAFLFDAFSSHLQGTDQIFLRHGGNPNVFFLGQICIQTMLGLRIVAKTDLHNFDYFDVHRNYSAGEHYKNDPLAPREDLRIDRIPDVVRRWVDIAVDRVQEADIRSAVVAEDQIDHQSKCEADMTSLERIAHNTPCIFRIVNILVVLVIGQKFGDAPQQMERSRAANDDVQQHRPEPNASTIDRIEFASFRSHFVGGDFATTHLEHNRR